MPGEVLIITCRGPAPAREVCVLLDGRPAADQPTVYMTPEIADTVRPGCELRYAFVLTSGGIQFETIEVRWLDRWGRRQSFVTGSCPGFAGDVGRSA